MVEPSLREVRRCSRVKRLRRWFESSLIVSNRGCARPRERLECVPERGGESKESGELFLYSPLKVLLFVGLMSGMLLLMYFFYNIVGT